MTVKELKKIIEKLPDTMRVGGIGHFGEILEITSIIKHNMLFDKETILWIQIEDAGEEPD